MANIIKPSSGNSEASTPSLQNTYIQNMNSSNRLSERSPYDGMLDKNGEIRLRLAFVDNPELKRNNFEKIDPTKMDTIFNANTGKLALRWVDTPGGVVRPNETGGKWEHLPDNEKYNPEEREYDNWNIDSRREMVSLTHPFIWANENNYCGFNYIPPVGSMVVVGFRKHGFPIILGYIPTHYKVCYPVLKPGEMVMKGYGNNYTHWRWSEKIDMKAWSVKDAFDNDDPEKLTNWTKKNDTNCTLWIRLNANDRYIKLIALETDPEPHKAHESHQTALTITPKNLTMISTEISDGDSPSHTLGKNSSYFQDEANVNIDVAQSGSSSHMMMKCDSIYYDTGVFTVNANSIDLKSNGPVALKGSTINLN